MTLAAFALALKLLVPQGFMLAEPGAGFPLVICTGHGPMALADHDAPGAPKTPAQKRADAPCTGAGAVTPVTPPAPVAVSAPAVLAAEPLLGGEALDLMPGRGLAAPPPPSQAPPAVSI